VPTGLGLDNNGRPREARDAREYGRFSGDGGLAILSRWPIYPVAATDLSDILWSDISGAALPKGPLWSDDIAAIQRLSSSRHWIAPIMTPQGAITLLVFSAIPPVPDGPKGRNGLHNRDGLSVWSKVLDGAFGQVADNF
jgi:hypothetical protein